MPSVLSALQIMSPLAELWKRRFLDARGAIEPHWRDGAFFLTRLAPSQPEAALSKNLREGALVCFLGRFPWRLHAARPLGAGTVASVKEIEKNTKKNK